MAYQSSAKNKLQILQRRCT